MTRVLKIVMVGSLLLIAAMAYGFDYGWRGDLMGLNEVPPNASPATGTIYAYLSADCDSLYYWGDWSGLVAPYSASHFHAAPAGVNGGVQLGTIGAGQNGVPFNGGAFSAANVSRLHHDSIYFNVHTQAFPGGEIRDQMHCEPDTASFDAQTDVGTSQCIQLCGGEGLHSLIRVRNLGSGQYPVVTKRFGCSGIVNPCDVNCCPTDHITEYFGGYWWWDGGWFCLEISGNGCACITLDQILAVELGQFDAIAGDGQVTLNWMTRSETDNDRFEIERNGKLIGVVHSEGTSSSGSSYQWIDNGLTNGVTYTYTLFAVDINGARSNVATENATPAAPSMVTEYALHGNYPNPFNPETQISFDLAEAGLVHLTVYDLLGRSVASVINGQMAQGRHMVAFNAGDLPSGVYLYRLEANGFSDQRKMLLLK